MTGGRSAITMACALAVVLGTAAFLRLHRLGDGCMGDPGTAATVLSMSRSWHNFFYAAWDPAGTYMQDKPPLAYWAQTLSAKAFGFRGFSLMLPQALAGLAGVVLLFMVVHRLHGRTAALLAAAVLAVLPVSVAVSRSNKTDPHLLLWMLAAVWLLLEAARSRRRGFLVAAAAAAGLAYNVKGMAVGVFAPAALVVLVSRIPLKEAGWRHALALSMIVCVVTAFAWTVAVELTPANARPIVSNSDDNSLWNIIWVHNGFGRFRDNTGFDPARHLTNPIPSVVPIGVLYGGPRGPLRVFGEFPGGLIAAVLPLALAGVALLLADLRVRAARGAALFWLAWLGCGWLVFSVSRLGSSHYLELFSPPLAAAAGLAAASLIRDRGWRAVIGAGGVAGSALVGLTRFAHFEGAGGAVVAVSGASLLVLCVAGLATRRLPWAGRAAAAFAVAAVLCVPLLLSWASIREMPAEGVISGTGFLTLDRRGRGDPAWDVCAHDLLYGRIDHLESALDYLAGRHREGQYLAAAPSFHTASAMIVHSGISVLPLFNEFRTRPELSAAAAERLVREGRLRYFLFSPRGRRLFEPQLRRMLDAGRDVSAEAGLDPAGDLRLVECGSE